LASRIFSTPLLTPRFSIIFPHFTISDEVFSPVVIWFSFSRAFIVCSMSFHRPTIKFVSWEAFQDDLQKRECSYEMLKLPLAKNFAENDSLAALATWLI
jgi:hypothetical protein